MTWQRHIQELISRSDDDKDSRYHHSNHGQYQEKRLPHRSRNEVRGEEEETR